MKNLIPMKNFNYLFIVLILLSTALHGHNLLKKAPKLPLWESASAAHWVVLTTAPKYRG